MGVHCCNRIGVSLYGCNCMSVSPWGGRRLTKPAVNVGVVTSILTFANVKALAIEEAEAERPGKYIPQPWGELEVGLSQALDKAPHSVDVVLCDSFNTPLAMSIILDLVSAANLYMSSTESISLVKEVARWVTPITTIFGLDRSSGGSLSSLDRIGWSTASDGSSSAQEIALPYVRLLSSFRDRVRAMAIASPASISSDLLALCDRLRDVELADLGVSLDDRDSSCALSNLCLPGSSAWRARRRSERRPSARPPRKPRASRAKKKRGRSWKRPKSTRGKCCWIMFGAVVWASPEGVLLCAWRAQQRGHKAAFFLFSCPVRNNLFPSFAQRLLCVVTSATVCRKPFWHLVLLSVLGRPWPATPSLFSSSLAFSRLPRRRPSSIVPRPPATVAACHAVAYREPSRRASWSLS